MRIFLFIVFSVTSMFTYAKNADYQQTLSSAADIIAAQFYSKEIGERVAQQLRKKETLAKFSNIKNKQGFAELVSKELRQVSGDNHIGIVYSPEDVNRYRVREQASKDKAAQQKDQTNYKAKLAESRVANFGIQQLRVLEGEVGYIEVSYFDGFVEEAAPVFQAAMNFLASSKVIILDLRRNGGGNSRILPLFLGYFLGSEAVHFANKSERWKNQQTKLYTDAAVQGTRHTDKPVYILTSGTTFSLAEHVTYHLKAFGRATVVGERTYGGGKAFDPVVLSDDFYLRLPRIEMSNTVTKTMYQEGQGITPDLVSSAESAFDVAYIAALELLESQSSDRELRQYYQWVHRVVSAKANQGAINFELPDLTGQHHFDEFTFEIRQNELWMSFRSLPWVKLINLGNGYFYDDRSIQRQFKFEKHDSKLALHVCRLMREERIIAETQ